MSGPHKVLLLGQAPGNYGREPGEEVDPRLALFPFPKGCAGYRLAQLLCGKDPGARGRYLMQFERRNLLPVFPGEGRAGDKFSMARARKAADALIVELNGRRVLVVGQATAEALGLQCPILVNHIWRGVEWGVIPHTSGRNRYWNDLAAHLRAQEFARRFCGLTPDGR